MSNLQQKQLSDKIKELMDHHPDLFPTEARFWSYLRGSLRRSLWDKSPMKHRYKNSKMQPPPEGYTGRGKKGAECSLTGEWTMTSKMEVDHKDGHKSLRCEDDIIPFIIHLLASSEEELQLVEKEAHKIKSYAERSGISFEDAIIEKQIIALKKLNMEALKSRLESEGILVEKGTKKADMLSLMRAKLLKESLS